MLIDTDFSNVPDTVPQVEPGAYSFLIKAYEFREAQGKKKATHSFQLQIESAADGSETPMKGRTLFDDFPPEFFVDKGHPVTVRFKQFLQSSGTPLSGGIDIEALKGKSVRGLTAKRTFKKEGSSEESEQAYVKQYLFTK